MAQLLYHGELHWISRKLVKSQQNYLVGQIALRVCGNIASFHFWVNCSFHAITITRSQTRGLRVFLKLRETNTVLVLSSAASLPCSLDLGGVRGRDLRPHAEAEQCSVECASSAERLALSGCSVVPLV